MKPNSPFKRQAVYVLIIPMLLLMSCDGPDMPTYNGKNDPFPVDQEPPQLQQVVPEAGFPGDRVTITGSGFRPHKDETIINVGEGVADIEEISNSEIIAYVPQNESGVTHVRAAVWGSDLWSNNLTFEYLADFADLELTIFSPTGIAVDNSGNLFIGSEDDQAVYRIDGLDSVQTVYANLPVTGPMEFGPNGQLFVVTDEGLAAIPDGGGSHSVIVQMNALADFDWNANGDIYLLQGSSISRFAGGQLEEGLGRVSMASKMRVFDGHIYVTELFRSRVVRFEIQGGSLGDMEIFANIGTPLAGLDVDANGNVYASAYIRDYVYKIPPNYGQEGVETEEIPNETQRTIRATSIDDQVVDIYLHNTVMYLVQSLDSPGEIGRIWRIFIGEPAAPKPGRN
ncbi:IPT/TIG domain-containing protein [Balneolales bacterium ANBcel1]|nr:IPT/TIG domain-containing protein [Balneolales bacterium ANBcel1]